MNVKKPFQLLLLCFLVVSKINGFSQDNNSWKIGLSYLPGVSKFIQEVPYTNSGFIFANSAHLFGSQNINRNFYFDLGLNYTQGGHSGPNTLLYSNCNSPSCFNYERHRLIFKQHFIGVSFTLKYQKNGFFVKGGLMPSYYFLMKEKNTLLNTNETNTRTRKNSKFQSTVLFSLGYNFNFNSKIYIGPIFEAGINILPSLEFGSSSYNLYNLNWGINLEIPIGIESRVIEQ